MRYDRRFLQLSLAVSVLATLACSEPPVDKPAQGRKPPPAATQKAQEQVERMQVGERFPAARYNNLNPAGPAEIELASDLGTRSIVLHYWIAGNPRAEEVFQDLERLVDELDSEKLVLYGVAVPRDNLANASQIRTRVQELGLRSPVLEDANFTIGQRVGTHSVPHISVIDRSGHLRLTNGAALVQKLAADLDLAQVIRNAAEESVLPDHGALARYYPVMELEGHPSPDFRATLLSSGSEKSLHGMLDDDKLNVLVFWSVDCPHCREELPRLNDWLQRNPDVNLVTCARALDDATRTKTQQFSDSNNLGFETMLDVDGSIVDLYRITSTPTVLLVRPDGVVDSAIIAHSHDGGGMGAMIERRKTEILSARVER